MAAVGRNSACPCGSGERYKDCCGRLPATEGDRETSGSTTTLAGVMQQALAAQQAMSPRDADRLYRKALAIAPDEPDALHMLGVLRYEQGHSAEAAKLILRALDLTGWKHETFVHNLGLALSHAYRARADHDLSEGLARMERLRSDGALLLPDRRVAVIVPCYNHERYVRRALESVFAQSHRAIELIVIDDGSRDASVRIARETLAGSPFPSRFVARDNRGAAATINEGIGWSSAPFINVLNSDDWFAPDRIEVMVASVAAKGADWGFSDILAVDEADRAVDSERARVLAAIIDSISAWPTAGFAFVGDNVAISSGNIFFSRALYDRIGPFRDLRYNHDWEFCLRALRVAEPVFVSLKAYGYRLHPANTIADAMQGGGRTEADGILADYIRWAISEPASGNPIAPTSHNWGMHFLCSLLGRGFATLLEPDLLRRMTVHVDDLSFEPCRESMLFD
jgi:hypothetical protein